MDPFLSQPQVNASLEPGQLHVWRLHLALPADRVAAMRKLLSTPESDKASRFRFERDRVRYVAAHAGLRLVLAGYLGCEAASVPIAAGPLGKPLLSGPHSVPPAACPPVAVPEQLGTLQAASGTISFNLSHSGEWGLLAVGLQRYVGVDIEQERELPDVAQLGPAVLTPTEAAMLDECEPERRASCFLAMWTRKEAAVKAMGIGIGAPLETIEIEPADPAVADAFTVRAGWGGGPHLFGRTLHWVAGYRAAVVCDGGPPEIARQSWP